MSAVLKPVSSSSPKTSDTFTVVSGNHTRDPIDPNRYKLTAVIPAEQVVKLKKGIAPWGNPRLGAGGGRESEVAPVIRESFYNELGKFHSFNRGITIVAESAKLDKNTLSVIYGSNPEKKKYGLCDGGTTAMVLNKCIEDGFTQSDDPEQRQLVNLEIRCGSYTPDEVNALTDALNKNREVDDYSLANHRGNFEWLKKAMPEPKFPKIAYYFGDVTAEDVANRNYYNVSEIVSMLTAFTATDEDGNPYPVLGYYGTAKSLDYYIGYDEEHPNGVNKPPIEAVRVLEPVLSDLLSLYETIPAKLREVYSRGGRRKFGSVCNSTDEALIHVKKRGPATYLPHTKQTVDFTIHKAWRLPMFSAFRVAYDAKRGRWHVDPHEVYEEVGGRMFDRIVKLYDKGRGSKLRQIGMDTSLYELLRSDVEKAIGF